MAQLPRQQLIESRLEMQKEIDRLEAQIEPLQERLSKLREDVRAIDRLVGPLDGQPTTDEREQIHSTPARVGTYLYAPTHLYWIPILESLVELGGRGDADTVLNKVEKKMRGLLTPQDYELLPTGISVRWRNRAQWQRKNMIQQKLMSANSPRGVWEITLEGRRWLDNAKKKLA